MSMGLKENFLRMPVQGHQSGHRSRRPSHRIHPHSQQSGNKKQVSLIYRTDRNRVRTCTYGK